MLAKSQHLPLERWLVMGAPSRGIWTLKTCGSEIWAGRERRVVSGEDLVKVEIASLGGVLVWDGDGCGGERVPVLGVF